MLVTNLVSNQWVVVVLIAFALTCISSALTLNIAMCNDLVWDPSMAATALGFQILGGNSVGFLAAPPDRLHRQGNRQLQQRIYPGRLPAIPGSDHLPDDDPQAAGLRRRRQGAGALSCSRPDVCGRKRKGL